MRHPSLQHIGGEGRQGAGSARAAVRAEPRLGQKQNSRTGRLSRAAEQGDCAKQQIWAMKQELGNHRPHRHLRGREMRQAAGAAVTELQCVQNYDLGRSRTAELGNSAA